MGTSYGIRLREDPELQKIVRFKALMLRSVRRFLEDEEGAFELPMPLLWRTREGAPIDQWTTTDPVTGEGWFLRHCMEDHLRRMTPTFPRVFEVGKAVRAERRSAWHATEFLVLELAFADLDYEAGLDLVQRIVTGPVADSVECEYSSQEAQVFRSLHRTTWRSLAETVLGGPTTRQTLSGAAVQWLRRRGLETGHYTKEWEALEDLMKHGLEPACEEPTLIANFPSALQHVCEVDSTGDAQRMSLVMRGVEFADGGVKFAGSDAYRRIYTSNAEYRERVLGLGMNNLPEDFFAELAANSAPVFTCGIGLDRLTALVSGRDIHDVIQFPEG